MAESALVDKERQTSQVRPKLLALKGLPGSGKTTFARQLVDDGWVRVNKDDLRSMLNNGKWSKGNEAYILALRDEIIISSLVQGKNVVVDDTNLDPKHRIQFESIAAEFMADYSEKFFDTPVEECVKRNSFRAEPVPEKVIWDMYHRYLARPEVIDEEKEEAIIVDVDGTLAHIVNGRSPYDAANAMEDELDDAVSVITAMAYGHGYKVIILTGRSAEHKQVTIDWLKENGVEYDEIYTRASGDNTKDAIVKRDIYQRFIAPRYKVKFVLDDRNQVVDMWRELGLKCLQVAPGDF